jgi:hypothetical protein
VVGLSDPIATTSLAQRLTVMPANIQVLRPLVVSEAYVAKRSADPLTDDRAPVEWITDRAILTYIAAGGVLDEQLLPTAP